ncbi:hypothetical protein HS048_30020 [Planomonospora sp. ID91781]|uniref:hypothetical protein n=1 Tax=Planomonospora sp. ID91781 TaxID=2738135 RepID=UPI0018C3BA5C|nr:hypothetical protein [Planomonospora sp. ID91781]MBG0824938.1 hypothetical protein [Planomonospora sp. ID91781]
MLLISLVAVVSDGKWRVKRRSAALLLITALVAVPTLSTATPLDCGVRPLTEAEHLALDESLESFLGWQREELRKEGLFPTSSPLPWMTADGYTPDVKADSVAPPIGVEIVEPPGCPEISDSH